MIQKLKYLLLTFLVSAIFTQVAQAQFQIPEIPKLQTSLYDYANLLNADEKTALEEKLIRYSDSTTTQIVVITIDDLKGENIDQLATNWGQKWGIGQKNEDNGVFILVAKNDRKIALHPGYGAEERLTAGICGEIIRNTITPEFKAGSYYNGLNKGADAIFDALKGKYKGERKSDSGGKFPFAILIFIAIIIFAIISRNRRGGGGRGNSFGGGGDFLTGMIIGSLKQPWFRRFRWRIWRWLFRRWRFRRRIWRRRFFRRRFERKLVIQCSVFNV
ncbi:TPM domain-containing protein [Flavobacterium sp. 3HN19-14]|uniref:TPM domain-containing protein n=1 Tax=Flavobacterium sp. 3HN19-14 TaxID=3448133 RepID=UPI003EE0CE3F